MDSDFMTFQSVVAINPTHSDVFARFYDKSVKTDEINPKTGMPIFKDVCYVEIRIKNNNTDIYNQPASDEKIHRFPAEYNRYLMAKKQVENGTPLENFAFLTAAQTDTLKFHGIFTVEALADISEQQAQDLDLSAERQSAIRFMKSAQANLTQIEWQGRVDNLLAEIDVLKAEIDTQKTHIDDLEKQLSKLQEKQTVKSVRSRKTKQID